MGKIVQNPCLGQSKNYKSFKRLPGNRDKSKGHLKALERSIRTRPDLLPSRPVLVNEKMQVIDGQHRKEICEELGLPVYYVQQKGLTLTDAQIINSTSKNWLPMDYAISFEELGNENYSHYINAVKKFHFNFEVTLYYLRNSSSCDAVMFKAGAFTVGDVDESFKRLQQLMDVKPFYEGYKIRAFAFAFLQAMSTPEYDHERMIKQLQKYNNQLIDHRKPQGYLRNLEDIYNYRYSYKNSPRLFGSNRINLATLTPGMA